MKLIHRRGVLVDLGVHDPAEYGFDTFQLANIHSGSSITGISAEVTEMDNHFTEENDFVLSFTPNGDPRMGSGSGVGSISRDPWYDNSGADFYSDMDSLFDAVQTKYGSRFKGMRWNHEHRPRQFSEGSKWAAYAQEHAASDYAKVQNTYQPQWIHYLTDIAGSNPQDAYKDIGRAKEPPYNGTEYTRVKRLYKHFVDFQCEAQARMFDILAQKLGGNRKLILYTVQRSPVVYANSEYAVDFREVTDSRVVGEISTWDLARQTNQNRNDWAAQQGTKPYFFALQQGGDNTDDISDDDHIISRTNRVRNIINNCLDPEGAQDPWDDSFAFWCGWRKSNPGDPEITVAQQQAYMNKVKAALT